MKENFFTATEVRFLIFRSDKNVLFVSGIGRFVTNLYIYIYLSVGQSDPNSVVTGKNCYESNGPIR